MKNRIKMSRNLLIITLVVIIGFSMAACKPEEEKRNTITISEILGVTAPVAGATPVSEITPNEQYSGTVGWGNGGISFEAETEYTAEIRLSEKEGWTTTGLPAGFFTVAGATVTYDANSLVIYAKFPKTGLNTFTGITEFGTWLKARRANTKATPFKVKLNIDSLGGNSSDDGSVGSVLREHISDGYHQDYRFVIIDLSDSTMTNIETSAFSSCPNLVGLIMGDRVTSIGSYSFYNCGITSITIGNNVTSIGEQAFSGSDLTSVNIPAGVTSIEESVFYNCQSLTSVNIPAGVTSIGAQAFNNCQKLTSVNIPAAVATIGNIAFSSCYALTAITVDAANAAYSSDNGVLYNKNKTTLIAYPAGKAGDSFTIPDGVTTIGGSAFDSNRNLTGITIPVSVTSSLSGNDFYTFDKLAAINVAATNSKYSSDNGVLYDNNKTTLIRYPASKTGDTFAIPATVTTIDQYAFYNCGFASITIPSTVTEIKNAAFYSRNNLTSVKFEGTIDATKFSTTNAFYGDLRTKYLATPGGGVGTYTRSSSVWTKQP